MFRVLLFSFLLLFSSTTIVSTASAADLLAQYRQKLSTYRTSYDRVFVALQQYTSLGTLSAQEEAVNAMREFLLIRTEVLTTHLDILSGELGGQELLDADLKASSSALLLSSGDSLVGHHDRSTVAVDRIRADQEALWLSTQEPLIRSSADRAQSLIGIGKTLQAIAYLETVKQKIDTWIASSPMSESQKTEKRRGSDELGRTIGEAKSSIDNVRAAYRQGTQGGQNTLIYPQLRTGILSSYASVRRGVEFAQELTQ